jgi:hypothetical protein
MLLGPDIRALVVPYCKAKDDTIIQAIEIGMLYFPFVVRIIQSARYG